MSWTNAPNQNDLLAVICPSGHECDKGIEAERCRKKNGWENGDLEQMRNGRDEKKSKGKWGKGREREREVTDIDR